MATATVVAVYGVPAGQSRVQRLGSGTLPLRQLVVVDPPLDDALDAAHPPRPIRVVLGSVRDDGELFLELRDVLQVIRSAEGHGERMWALELTEPAESPISFGDGSGPAPPHPVIDADRLAELLRRSRPSRPIFPGAPFPHSPVPHPPEPPPIIPAGLWCVLFPRATFCRH
ncbi:MAG TPA: hypothetical protein VFP34_12235 [Microlunatus sp.]|nr:hypothetical protein [Microlunatus sp.]